MTHRNTTDRTTPRRAAPRALAAAVILAAGGPVSSCKKPIDVNVGAAEPIQLDVSMDVHVYQHGEVDEEARAARMSYQEVMTRKRNRMGEVRTLKDNRLVGESYEGLLSIRNLPAGDYGTYVKKTVEEENEDRNFLMQYEAKQEDKPLPEIRREHWRHAQRKSFPGEWIHVEDGEEPGAFRWIQKKKSGEGEAG